MTFRIRVDPANPGQFFACCGLFELTTRIDRDARARFEANDFFVTGEPALGDVLRPLVSGELIQIDPDDDTASPIRLPPPFDVRLDWWKDDRTGGRELKVWAGSMRSVRIAQAMIAALRDESLHTEQLLDYGTIVFDPADVTNKVEPFYFDARRAPNAHSRDIGFSPNDLELTTTAFPAVEALCLVGLQRFRPAGTSMRRVYEYRTWSRDLPIAIVPAVVCGVVPMAGTRTYRFECWYRTGQKKQKAFRPAIPLEGV